jgi:hypothetical protein
MTVRYRMLRIVTEDHDDEHPDIVRGGHTLEMPANAMRIMLLATAGFDLSKEERAAVRPYYISLLEMLGDPPEGGWYP